MESSEYLIDVTAVYTDGTKDSIMIRQKDNDGESARSAVAAFFNSYQATRGQGVKSLTATLIGPARQMSAGLHRVGTTHR